MDFSKRVGKLLHGWKAQTKLSDLHLQVSSLASDPSDLNFCIALGCTLNT